MQGIPMRSQSANKSKFDDWLRRVQRRRVAGFQGRSRCYIGVLEARELARVLRKNSSLKSLCLGKTKLRDEGVKELSAGLSRHSRVAHLNLEFNSIGDEGITALADALRRYQFLTHLNLHNNHIGDKGVCALANVLHHNASLTKLYLSYNNIGNNGVSALANVLRDNASLTELYLRSNDIGDEGASALKNALCENCSLTHLDLEHNSFDNESLGLLAYDLVRINRHTSSPHAALAQKVRLLVESKHGSEEAAVSLALIGINRFPASDQQQDILDEPLGSPELGKDVASSVDLATGKDLCRYAAECSAGMALMNLLRAHPSLLECRDEKYGMYPFMLLAVTPAVGAVGDVFEVLLMKPELVASSTS